MRREDHEHDHHERSSRKYHHYGGDTADLITDKPGTLRQRAAAP
jgi:hypothetical protein